MPLISSVLQNALLALFKSNPSASDAAKGIAKAYSMYAMTATAGAAKANLTGLESQAMEKALSAVFASVSAATPATASMALASGVVAFWMMPPVTFSGAQAGAVFQAATAMPIITGQVAKTLANQNNSPETAAMELATALDMATRTVTVALAPPPGTVSPLT